MSTFLVANASVYAAGPAYVYPDWTGASLLQTASFAAGANPGTFTNRLNSAAPTFPIPVYTSYVGLLADPSGSPVSWIQGFRTGNACTTGANMTQLQVRARARACRYVFAYGVLCISECAAAAAAQSVAVGPGAADVTGLVVNASVPACPLPRGLACFDMIAAHMSAFTNA